MTRVVRTGGRLAFVIAAIFSVLIALVSYRFLPLGVESAMEFMAHHLAERSLALYAHIGVAPVALALMPFQFVSGLRSRRPALHRWLGRFYVSAVLVSGVAGIQLAFYTAAGSFAATGFALLAVIWLATTGAAFYFAMTRQFDRHRDWMLRSAALTFAAVTLRIYLAIAMVADIDFDVAYPLISWLAWVPNALVVEAWLRRKRAPSRRSSSTEPRTA
ncbi:DUF2306 domain-containing protein [Roseibium sp. Sym1]|uniref:DUF2306 domain-containing protein n=1 Tax=Roseibium sp. Sym1 TaxID=3016006 RepID=UPI0022B397EF|nr:DUF2306 domain-containing protein [Roseibium sp. Sym1]